MTHAQAQILSERRMPWSRLNVFQRLTRQWDSLHPYNAAQAMRLSGRPDREALAAMWGQTLLELNLAGAVSCDGRRFRWETVSNRSPQNDFLTAEPGISLDEFMSRELNRSFHRVVELPFRPFVLEAGDGSYWAGVVYHHWVADSYSIRVLLREWFLRLFDPAAARRRPLRIATQGYWSLFGPERARWGIGGSMLGLARWGARFRRARRIDWEGSRELAVNFTLHQAREGLIEAIRPAARRVGVTVNDVFLAAMAQACDEHVPVRRTPRREDLALGTIVDLRPLTRQPLDDAFGLYLGFTSIFCRPGDLPDSQRLLQRVHQQNAMQKSTSAAQASMMRMLAGLVVARLFKPKSLLEFYRKRLSLAGGISNVNLNREWPAKYHPAPLLDYVRVSPAGPMMPVVFTPTTLGRRLNIGLTCRSSVVPPEQAAELARHFIARLEEFVRWAS